MQNKSKIYLGIGIAIVAILCIVGGIHHHRTHEIDGTWYVQTADGRTPKDYQLATLTIKDNQDFTVKNEQDTYKGTIERNRNNKQIKFVVNQESQTNRKQTDSASYGLTSDKKQMTLDFADTSKDMTTPLGGASVVLVKKGSSAGNQIESSSASAKESEKQESQQSSRDKATIINRLKGKTINGSYKLLDAQKVQTDVNKGDGSFASNNESNLVKDATKNGDKQSGSAIIPEKIHFNASGSQATVTYAQYDVKNDKSADSNPYTITMSDHQKATGSVSIEQVQNSSDGGESVWKIKINTGSQNNSVTLFMKKAKSKSLYNAIDDTSTGTLEKSTYYNAVKFNLD